MSAASKKVRADDVVRRDQQDGFEKPALIASAQPANSTSDFQIHRPDTAHLATLAGLQIMAGVRPSLLMRLVLKEAVDNALDEADAVGQPGAVQLVQHDERVFSVTDHGRGLPGTAEDLAGLFSIHRHMRTTKFWRTPQRGALGNGTRVLTGSLVASRGSLTVETRGQRVRLRPLRHATEIVDVEPIPNEPGTTLIIAFGPDMPDDEADDPMRWGRLAIDASAVPDAAPPYDGFASPHWLDAEQLADVFAAIEPPTATVRQLVEKLAGCSGAKAGRLAAPFGKNRVCSNMLLSETADLLRACQEATRPIKHRDLSPLGPSFDEATEYAKREGVLTIGRTAPVAQVPVIVEAWSFVHDREGSDSTLTVFVNRSPVISDASARRGWSGSKNRPLVLSIGSTRVEVEVPLGRARVAVHIITPFMPISSIGKAPDIRPFADLIAEAVKSSFNRSRQDAPLTEKQPRPPKVERPPRPPSQAEVISSVLDQAIAHTSSNGQFAFSLRNLFYSVRPLVARFLPGQELKYGYFSQVIGDYENEHGDIAGLLRDPRGTFQDGNTVVPLGTTDVAAYDRPAWKFHKLLFVEKEDTARVLVQAGWDRRHDCAVMSSKGYAGRAAKDLIDKIAATGEPVIVFCLHDCDCAGGMIAETLQRATRARGARSVQIVDLGLYPWQALDMGLPVEPCRYDNMQPVSDAVREHPGRDWATWLQRNRIELNALRPEDLIRWLDREVKKHGPVKLIPPDDIVRNEFAAHVRERATDTVETAIGRSIETAIATIRAEEAEATAPLEAELERVRAPLVAELRRLEAPFLEQMQRVSEPFRQRVADVQDQVDAIDREAEVERLIERMTPNADQLRSKMAEAFTEKPTLHWGPVLFEIADGTDVGEVVIELGETDAQPVR
jgi:hypothetical protein